MRHLEKLLSKSRLTRAEAGNRAFDSAFFRPPSGAMRERWDEHCARRAALTGSSETVAQTLLLSYRSNAGGSLWLLEASRTRQSDVTLSARVHRTLERSTLLVSRELPALVSASQGAAAWSVSRVHTAGETVLDGESFGLSMCLAAAAHCLGLPSPTTVVAAAVVDSDGVLFEVGGLAEKLSVLHDWALGVESVIVAASQSESARAIAKTLGASWRIVSARTVAEAVASAFPSLWTDLLARWSEPTKLVQVAGDLHRLARDGSNHVLSWKGIADAAGRVAARLPETTSAGKDARFAQVVARRHEGHDALLALDHEYLASMRRPLRLRCLAHIAQSHGDCAEVLDPSIERAVADMLPASSREDSGDDLLLLGALGRTLAAFFRYEAAEVALCRAVRGWFELDRVAEASHALCELLRVVALTRPSALFAEAVRAYAEQFVRDPRVDAVSRGFVLYSLGRGYALLGDWAEAHRWLSDVACEWMLLPDHLRALRLRWLIRTARSLQDGVKLDVGQLGEQLVAIVERAPALKVASALVVLDEAEQHGSDASAALRAFELWKPIEYKRFLAASGADLAPRLAREYRY